MRRLTFAATLLLLLSLGPAIAQAAGDDSRQAAAPTVLLDLKSFWRAHLTQGTELVRLRNGELTAVHDLMFYERRKEGGKWVTRLRPHPQAGYWPLPPADWTAPDFNDYSWALLSGPFGTGPYKSPSYWYRSIPLLCLRGKFEISDPARCRDVRLSLGIHGGAVVYLNGRELTRIALPAGRIDPLTPAEDYPLDAFLTPRGELLSMRGPADAKKYPQRFALRIRGVRDLHIDPSWLRRGTNVLAIEIHRAPAPEVMYTGRAKGITREALKRRYAWWPRAALVAARLTARGAGVVRRPRPLHVWGYSVTQMLTPAHDDGPAQPPKELYLVGARNGAFSAQVVAAADRPTRGLGVRPTALKGPGGAVIAASAVEVRYGLADAKVRRGPVYFSGLEVHPPALMPLRGQQAIQPIWITVHVPADAPAGEYAGQVEISAQGERPLAVPLRLRVHGWSVPDSKEFFTFIGMFQSPESVAMQYKVPMWSQRHWRLVGKSLEQMGRIGVKTVYITAIRQTHLGNRHAMIRFVRRAGGQYEPDFSIAERYLDLAVRHLGKVPVVGLYCWETYDSGGKYHFGRYARKDRPILITVVDPATGALSEAEGPRWGTPQCRAFWRPVFDGVRRLLARYGMADSLMAGVCGDFEPTAQALADIKAASGGVPWISHSHTVRHGVGPKRQYPTGYIAAAWGGHARLADPQFAGRAYGWKNDFHRVMTRSFPTTPTAQRLCLERLVCSSIMPRRRGDRPDYGLHGIGRLGADFWPVLGKEGKWYGTLFAHYPQTRWGQLNVALWMPAMFSPGKDGAIATVRSEMFRENAQEIEARIFIEKVLLDSSRRARLGDELATRCQKVLDDRIRFILRSFSDRAQMGPAWQVLSEKLYEAAAKVAEALGRQ